MARPAWPPPMITVSVYFMVCPPFDEGSIRRGRQRAVQSSSERPSIRRLFRGTGTKALLRRRWAAALATFVILSLTQLDPGFLVSTLVVVGLFFFVILRFGLLAGTVCNVTQVLFNAFIVTPELSSWHADATIAAILATLAIASFGLYTSTIRPLTAAPGRAPV